MSIWNLSWILMTQFGGKAKLKYTRCLALWTARLHLRTTFTPASSLPQWPRHQVYTTSMLSKELWMQSSRNFRLYTLSYIVDLIAKILHPLSIQIADLFWSRLPTLTGSGSSRSPTEPFYLKSLKGRLQRLKLGSSARKPRALPTSYGPSPKAEADTPLTSYLLRTKDFVF